MVSKIISVGVFDLIVMGGTGDLARRKLMPSLYYRFLDGQYDPATRLIGASRTALSVEDYREKIREALHAFVDADQLTQVDAFLAMLDYVSIDATADGGWHDLEKRLADASDRVRVVYLATAPGLFGDICQRLHQHKLITEHTRVVLEKPIGTDLASAKAINDSVGAVFDEAQIFRIDHYLGKETVQNLMALRFGNSLFEPLWNRAHIDHVQITVAETVGVEGRGGYYDKSGALRDMVQNHIMQLLCLVAMEPPGSDHADAVRDEKLKVLRSLATIDSSNVDEMTVRGQYGAGAVEGKPVPGYRDEIPGDSSTTETYAALRCDIANWRWCGVPFYLRTGKRLATKTSEIVVQFKSIPFSVFGPDVETPKANRLIIRLQPDEGIRLMLTTKDPGPGGMRLREAPLDISFAETFKVRFPGAYERLLMDVVRGNQTLFMRRDEVEEAWTWIEPIIDGWERNRTKTRKYAAGSWGPGASFQFMGREQRTWYDEAE